MAERRIPTKQQVLAAAKMGGNERVVLESLFPDDFAPAAWTDDQLAVSIRYDRGVLMVTHELMAHVVAMGHRLTIGPEPFRPGWGFDHGFSAWTRMDIPRSQSTAPDGWRGTSMTPEEAARAMARITEAAKVEA